MTEEIPLPEPDSPELEAWGITGDHRLIYNFLYERRDSPPTMQEVRRHVRNLTGTDDEQLDRRKRELHKTFRIQAVRTGREIRYRLVGWAEIINPNAHLISKRLRYEVLQTGRCNKCGRTAEADGVKLVVDHVIPQRWGGGNEITNLQALCEDCNGGKKDYYSQFDSFADQIRQAANCDEPHRRIAMLFRAFSDQWVPSELLGAVASARQYQEDWQKRARELRYLGWTLETKRERRAGARVQVYYRAVGPTALPEGNLAEEIRRIESQRRQAK
ncbi:HNH endonuclease [Oerskovia paurometabola]|uniref:HNH endonuclease n=1 Tax=Oerskovia paurometabola TaxID=162170 RepID=UPI00343A5B23